MVVDVAAYCAHLASGGLKYMYVCLICKILGAEGKESGRCLALGGPVHVELAATLRGSRPRVQSASLIMMSLMTS